MDKPSFEIKERITIKKLFGWLIFFFILFFIASYYFMSTLIASNKVLAERNGLMDRGHVERMLLLRNDSLKLMKLDSLIKNDSVKIKKLEDIMKCLPKNK